MRHLLVFLTSILLIAHVTYAQTATGTIAGTVIDASGGAVSNAEITAKTLTGGEARTTKTNPNGAYRFENIPPGVYNLSVTAPNFALYNLNGLNVTASAVTSQNMTLQVGGVQQVVEVNAGNTQIQLDNAELKANPFSTIEIQKLRSQPEPDRPGSDTAGHLHSRQPRQFHQRFRIFGRRTAPARQQFSDRRVR